MAAELGVVRKETQCRPGQADKFHLLYSPRGYASVGIWGVVRPVVASVEC